MQISSKQTSGQSGPEQREEIIWAFCSRGANSSINFPLGLREIEREDCLGLSEGIMQHRGYVHPCQGGPASAEKD